MLFRYPIASTADNWVHDCIATMIMSCHTRMDQGLVTLGWPEIVPLQFRPRIISRPGLRMRFNVYFQAVRILGIHERAQILKCFVEQNAIAELISCESNCDSLLELPETTREAIRSLFEFAFGLLTDLGLRDAHYEAIYDNINDHVCPFCGLEPFDAPGAIREDLDHYLPKSIYPFAAVNLRNLSPMGRKCNGTKLQKDILRNEAGIRRPSFDPYSGLPIDISLMDSIPFEGGDGQIPLWDIKFDPDSPECTAWDEIFLLRERMKRDVLDVKFNRWLKEFALWFKKRFPNNVLADNDIIEGIREYSESEALKGLVAREFLRAKVFEMLLHHCRGGNDRLLSFIRSLVVTGIR